MAISRIGAATAAGTSLTPSWSGAGAGEIEIAWAYRSGSATPPGLPAGWVRIKQEGANTNSGLLAYRFCPTSGNVATGTFSNATQLIVTRYKGCKGIGNVASSAVSSNSISYPALTMVQSAGNSWIFGAGGHRTATNVNTAPSGMTNITQVGNICAVHDTNASVSSWTGASATVNANSGHESMTIELLADGGAWSLYDSNGAPGWSLNTQNKVAQRDGAVGSLEAIRQFTGRSTGKWAVGFRLLSFGDEFDITFGLVTGPVSGGQSLTAWPDSGVVFVCDTNTPAGNAIYYDAGSQVDFGSGTMIQALEYGSMCVDLDAGKFWICHESMPDWNGNPLAHPNNGIGGISYTTGKGSTLFLWHSTGNQGSSFAINTFELNDVAPLWTFPANASDFQPWDNPSVGRTATAALSVGAVTTSSAATSAISAAAPVAVGAASVGGAATLAISASGGLTVGSVAAVGVATAPIDATAAIAIGSVTVAAEASSAEDRDATAELLVGLVSSTAEATAAIAASAGMSVGGTTVAAAVTAAIDAAAVLTPGGALASQAAAAIDGGTALAIGAVTVAATAGSEDGRFASAALQVGAVAASAAAASRIEAGADLEIGAVSGAGQAGSGVTASVPLGVGGVTALSASTVAIDATAALQVGAVMVAAQIGSPVIVISPEWTVTPQRRRRIIKPAGSARVIIPATRHRYITAG